MTFGSVIGQYPVGERPAKLARVSFGVLWLGLLVFRGLKPTFYERSRFMSVFLKSAAKNAAIVFQGVGKSFARHAGQMLIRERVMLLLRNRHAERFHALREISFAIGHGESVAPCGWTTGD